MAFDCWHFCGSYSEAGRAKEYLKVYSILKSQFEKTGPLYVFSEFNIDYDNKTIDIACYPFDALQNPKLCGTQPNEIALITNAHYSPFLQKRFSFLQYERLEKDSFLGLYLVSTSQISPAALKLWIEADRVYRDLNMAIKYESPGQSWSDFLIPFAPLETRDRSDPLLMSVYWEKVAFFKDLAQDYLGAAQAYQKAAEDGYPAAHLYYDRGTALKWIGEKRESEKAFKKAEELSKIPGA